MSGLVPKRVFFTAGAGRHPEMLESFEMALRDAGIEKYNLVTVSSILPPRCEKISREEGLSLLSPGEIVFVVMSRNSSNESSRRISASIGCAVPTSPDDYGYLSEHHSYGDPAQTAGMYAEKLASEMYQSWKGKPPLRCEHVARDAEVDEDGNWTTVVAAAVFIL